VTFSYSFVANWDFYRTAFARYRRQKSKRHRAIAVSIVIAAALLLAWIYGRSSDAVWSYIPKFALIGGVIGGVVGGVVGGATVYALGRIFLSRHIKRSPNYGATVAVTLDGEGLHATEPHAQVSLAWRAFTRVTRFKDGILLVRGSVIRWLPDTALQNATPEEVVAFVRSKTDVAIVG
jgi:hypothetical protein